MSSREPGPAPAVPADTAEELYENAPCGYLSTLPGGLITRVNRTFLSWTGYRAEDLVLRRRLQDLLTPGARIFHETHYAPLLQMQGEVREITIDVVQADGRRLPVLVNATLDRDEAGTALGARVVLFDVTERRRYERELLRQRRAAERSEARVRVLQRLTGALAAALDTAQISAVVAEELRPHLGVDTATLALADDDTGELVDVVGGAALDADSTESAAARSGAALFTGPGMAALPLAVDGRVLGVLRLDFPPGRVFAPEEQEFLAAFAGQCAQAVDRALLHARTAEATRHAALLAELTRALNEGLNTASRVDRLLGLLVPEVADCAIVDLVRGRDVVRVGAAPAGEVTDGEVTDGDVPANGGQPRVVTPSEAVARALAGGEHQFGTEIPLVRGRATSGVTLPLRTRGRVIGALTLACLGSGRRIRARDLAHLRDIADRTALALDNVRLFEQVGDVAHTLQQSMLAGTPPEDPRFEVTTRYRPAIENLEVGGDWHDTFLVADGVLGIVVGDVVGRGIVAASAMGQLRSAIRALAGTGLGPAALLRQLDGYVEHVEAASMATVVYAEITLGTGVMRYAAAGHLPPLVIAGDSEPYALWGGRSAPLGVFAGLPPRTEDEVTLPPGAGLLLYTDGLVERRTRSIHAGIDRLAAELGRRRDAPLPDLVDGVAAAMLADEDRRDDVCLLWLRYAGP